MFICPVVFFGFWTLLVELFAVPETLLRWGLLVMGFAFGVGLALWLAGRQKRRLETLRALVAAGAGAPAPDSAGMIDAWASSVLNSVRTQLEALKGKVCEAEEHAERLEETIQKHEQMEQEFEGYKTTMTDRLRGLAVMCIQASDNISKEWRSMAQMVADVNNGVEVQKYGLLQTTDAVAAAAQSVDEVFSGVASASGNAESSRELAYAGQKEVRDAASAVRGVQEVTSNLQNDLASLDSQLENIAKVMDAIGEVADHSNLLALNAAIEAARAGEAGKGFAVVAEEVQKLSQNTMQASKEIVQLVGDMRVTASAGVRDMEASQRQIAQSVASAEQADGLMESITRAMDESASALVTIGAAANTQRDSSHRTRTAIEAINSVMESSIRVMHSFTAGLVGIAEAMDDMHSMAIALQSGSLEAENVPRLVEWTPDLPTGIELIDSQHKMLCIYINALHRASLEGNQATIMDLVGCLKAYAATHFSTEEQYFCHSDYPEKDKHVKIHQHFVSQVDDIEKRLASGKSKADSELLQFLKDWLLNHIKVTDQRYVKYVQTAAAGLRK